MAETGQLGSADSYLGNLLPAFAGAYDALPSTGGLTGRLGSADSYLADLLFALVGNPGPQVVNVAATTMVVLTQSAGCVPAIVGHPSPSWTLGGINTEVGDSQLAYTGAAAASPSLGTMSGRLGLTLGGTVPGLAGIPGRQIVNVDASSTVVLVGSAGCVPTIVGHPAPSWTLGGQTEGLGSVQPAYVPVDLRPTTGDRTGVLGTASSWLANVRLALGDMEGDSSSKTWNVSATSTLSLSSTATVTNISRSVHGLSTVTLSSAAATRSSRGVGGLSTLELDGVAGTAVTRTFTVSAQSPISLSHQADWTKGNTFVVGAESVVELNSDATGRQGFVRASATSTLGLGVTASGRHSHFRPSATSTITLTTASTGRQTRFSPSATSTIEFNQIAGGWTQNISQDVIADSIIFLFDQAAARSTKIRAEATTPIVVSSSASARGTYVRDATSVLQTVTQSYNSEVDAIVTTITGLCDSAGCTISTARKARSVIPVRQQAGAYRLKTTAVAVSAENLLELTDQSWRNGTGDAVSRLTLSQAAVGYKANPTGSVLQMTDSAGVSVVRKRGACSVLELKQSVTYTLIRPDVIYKYSPFVGEGPDDAPTPPPATL